MQLNQKINQQVKRGRHGRGNIKNERHPTPKTTVNRSVLAQLPKTPAVGDQKSLLRESNTQKLAPQLEEKNLPLVDTCSIFGKNNKPSNQSPKPTH